MANIDKSLLQAALLGFEHQLAGIKAAIEAVKERLGEGPAAPKAPASQPKAASSAPKKRMMSAAAKKRIGEAQKKRWAEFHKRNKK